MCSNRFEVHTSKLYNMLKKRATSKIDNLKLFKPLDDDDESFESMQNSLKYILTVAMCLSIMPMEGVRGEASKLRFRWFSVKTFNVFLTIVLTIANTTMITIRVIKTDKGVLSCGKTISL